ncbi:MAG: hypothetical protein ACRDX8_00265 [Acidimicrobiales bacterium]
MIDFADFSPITTRFWTKETGARMLLESAEIVCCYGDSCCAANGLAGYERLILELMEGDRSLFTTAAQVERYGRFRQCSDRYADARGLYGRVVGADEPSRRRGGSLLLTGAGGALRW